MANRYQEFNTDYEVEFDGSAVRAPKRRVKEQPRRRAVQKTKRVVQNRPGVAVREAGRVSPFAVVGFAVVVLLAVLTLYCRTQCMEIEENIAVLETQVMDLQAENAKLTQRYETVFNSAAIEKAVGATMIHPKDSQYVYVNLSKNDKVVLYGENGSGGKGLEKAVQAVSGAVGAVVEYFS